MKPLSKRKLRPFACVSLLLLVFQAGCWSSHEIETQSIYVGLALDTGKQTGIEQQLEERSGGDYAKNAITATIQVLKPSGGGGGTQKSGEQKKPYLNITETGDSSFEILRELSLRTDRPPLGSHLKLIVIGSRLAQSYELSRLLDFYLLDNDIRPSCLVFISKGRAAETLDTHVPETIPAIRILGITDNHFRNLKLLPPISLARLEAVMRSDSSFLLQNIVSAEGEIKFAGAAVMDGKSKKLIGFLDEEELGGITWMMGKAKGGLIKSHDERTKRLITYEVVSTKTSISSKVSGGRISFRVKIESKGRLIENDVPGGEPSRKEFLEREKETFEKQLLQTLEHALDKMQGEYGVDAAGFGDRLRIQHPRVWEKVKNEWDETFRDSSVTFDVKLSITDYGASSGLVKE